jgi:hypothetical protein
MKLMQISATCGAAILMLGCAAWVAANSDFGIYYKSQMDADAALSQFDIDNPDCQLWTNWQKMCSRTGVGRSLHCVSTTRRQVKPSVPFCVKFPEITAELQPALNSRLRFCAKSGPTRFWGGADASKVVAEFTQCKMYERGRPFDGYRLADRLHPYCKKWIRGEKGVLKCGVWRTDPPCELQDGTPTREPRGENEIVIPYSFNPEYSPVHGVFCSTSK